MGAASLHDITSRHHSTTPAGGWEEYLPVWAGKGRSRGLDCWGERVPKPDKGCMRRPRRWELPGICRLVILNAIKFYCATVGQPPVVSGITPPANSRPKKRKKLSRYGGGFRKSTPELVRGTPEETIDCFGTFILILHIYYCMNLDPPVEQGSDAEIAVFKTLLGNPTCKTQLLKSIKTKFQVKSTRCFHDTL